jgi:type IV pilus assembly protein PilX
MRKQLVDSAHQTGVVLFIALVALVVMSLAAVALIRSVDTNTVIAGNLSFKQSAVLASDSGAEAAFDWLGSVSAAGNLASLNNNVAAQGYYATIPDLKEPVDPAKIYLDDPVSLRSNATWASSVALPLTPDRNQINYIIERMCLQEREPKPADGTLHCLFGAETPTPDLSDPNYQADAAVPNEPSPIYRVTVRVQGPKNTVSYTQAYAY